MCFACFEKALNTVLVAPLTRRRAAWIYSGTDVCGAVRAVVETLVSTRAKLQGLKCDDQAGEQKLAVNKTLEKHTSPTYYPVRASPQTPRPSGSLIISRVNDGVINIIRAFVEAPILSHQNQGVSWSGG